MTEIERQEPSTLENNSAYHFTSLAALRAAHGTLLKHHQESGDGPEFFYPRSRSLLTLGECLARY